MEKQLKDLSDIELKAGILDRLDAVERLNQEIRILRQEQFNRVKNNVPVVTTETVTEKTE